MNKKMVFYTLGHILEIVAALLVLPAIVSAAYGEPDSLRAFAVMALVSFLLGWAMSLRKPESTSIYAREGFVIVALAWVLMSALGAIPFMLTGAIPRFADAFFETVSGFTTTGATIFKEVESLGRGLLFWRSFTHWIGGMGVLVFVLIVLPLGGDRSMHLIRAEVPGPTSGKLVPRMRHMSRILYGIYLALTLLEVLLLYLGGMPLFDSFIHAFGTAGTGGFSCKNISIGAYNSAYIDVVIGVFMLLFGVNFNLYYFLLIKRGRELVKNEELRCYLLIVAAAVLAIALNIRGLYANFGESLRYAFFQVSSIITTTGYSTADFNLWPEFSRTLLVLIMFIGACASSTGGGIKVSRVMLLWRMTKRGVSHMLHPRSVGTVHLEGRTVEEQVLADAGVYFITYALIAAATVLLLALDNFSFETNFTAMAACLNNIGPGLGMVGPMGNFSAFSDFSKYLLSFDMLAGRLEIFPILILFAPSVWRAK